jgi:hypothetical protein
MSGRDWADQDDLIGPLGPVRFAPDLTGLRRALDATAGPRDRAADRVEERHSGRFGTVEDERDEIGRGVVLGVAADHRGAAVRSDHLALGNGVHRVVGALGVHLGAQGQEQLRDRRLVEQADPVHHPEMAQDLDPLPLGNDRPPVPLGAPYRKVGVDGHDQPVAVGARRCQVAHVPGVEQIEGAVREHAADPETAPLGALLDEARERPELLRGSGHEPAAPVSRSIAAASSWRLTVAVPSFITTTPPP